MQFLPPADFFLALRYLRPKRTFVSVITLLSILGPILGVALLVVVIAIMSGFDRDIRTRILGMQAHIQIFPGPSLSREQQAVIPNPGPLLRAIDAIGCQGAPVIEGPVLVQVKDQVIAKYVKGILPEKEKQVTSLLREVTGGSAIRDDQALIGEEKEVSLFNMSAGIQTDNGLAATVWARNVTDEQFVTTAFPAVAQADSIPRYPNAPRPFGVTVSKKF